MILTGKDDAAQLAAEYFAFRTAPQMPSSDQTAPLRLDI